MKKGKRSHGRNTKSKRGLYGNGKYAKGGGSSKGKK